MVPVGVHDAGLVSGGVDDDAADAACVALASDVADEPILEFVEGDAAPHALIASRNANPANAPRLRCGIAPICITGRAYTLDMRPDCGAASDTCWMARIERVRVRAP